MHLILFFLENGMGRIGPAYLGYLIPLVLLIIAYSGVVILYRRFTKEQDQDKDNNS